MARRRDLGGALAGLGQGLTQFGQLRASRQEDEEQQQAQAEQRRQAQLLQFAQLAQGGTNPQALQSLAQSSGVDLSGLDLSQFAPPEPTTEERLNPLMKFIVENPQMATADVVDAFARQLGVDQGEGARAGLTPLPGVPQPPGAGQVGQLQQLAQSLQAATPQERQEPIKLGTGQRLIDPETFQERVSAIQDPQKPIQVSPGSVVLDPTTLQPRFRADFAPQQAPQPRVNEQTVIADVNMRTVPGMRPELVGKPVRVQFENGQPVRVLGEAPKGFDPMEFLLGGGAQGGGQSGAPPTTSPTPGQNPFRK